MIFHFQEMEGPVKSAGIHVDYGGLQTKLSTLCLQLQYLNVILEVQKLYRSMQSFVDPTCNT